MTRKLPQSCAASVMKKNLHISNRYISRHWKKETTMLPPALIAIISMLLTGLITFPREGYSIPRLA
jgi:hypothetical protein